RLASVLMVLSCSLGGACGSPAKGNAPDAKPGDQPDAKPGDQPDAPPGDCHATSPSGYKCDPWSTHLLLSLGIKKSGNNLDLILIHDPDYEGPLDPVDPPPAHNFYTQYNVEVPLTPAVRDFLCVVFTQTAVTHTFDVSAADFLTTTDNHFNMGSTLLNLYY